MLKKQWSNPELKEKGINVTESMNCPICDPEGLMFLDSNPKNGHYCHQLKMWHQNGCPSLAGEDHHREDPCPTNGEHHWNGESHKSKCCCGRYDGGTTPS